MQQQALHIVECPRDAMQGWEHFIPTAKKIEYLNALLQCNFNTLDFGSFVSPKAIPQLADTAEVLAGIDLSNTNTKLLAIIANVKGAEQAVAFEQISYLGFPFSISETFQQRNTNASINQALQRVEDILALCNTHNKELVVYMSMGFGNPYGDEYNEEIALQRTKQIQALGVKTIAIADTVGLATATTVKSTLQTIIAECKEVNIGAHLHATSQTLQEKIEAALQAGCTRFDAAIKGIGGCPMAGNALVGNIDTEKMLSVFEKQQLPFSINKQALQRASELANSVFI
jgi:hydroxymethylglutaryl-CoA lyase